MGDATTYRQHHTVSSVRDGIAHVRHLSAGWARVLDHALKLQFCQPI